MSKCLPADGGRSGQAAAFPAGSPKRGDEVGEANLCEMRPIFFSGGGARPFWSMLGLAMPGGAQLQRAFFFAARVIQRAFAQVAIFWDAWRCSRP
jgi:hypothetical protein